MNFKTGRLIPLAFSLGLGIASAQTYVAIDLNSTNYAPTVANGIYWPYQVGAGTLNGQSHALMWQAGVPSSVRDLTPPTYRSASFSNISATNAVGQGVTSTGQTVALSWPAQGSPFPINLNPTIGTNAAFASAAYGSYSAQQVGYAQPATNAYYAYLWQGSASNAVNLQPNGYVYSKAYATDGGQQAGYATLPSVGYAHAMVWSGSASSFQDLNPVGYIQSYASAMSTLSGSTNALVAGYAETSTNASSARAYVWIPTFNQAINIHPSGYVNSFATGVNSISAIGYGTNSTGQQVALLWKNFSSPAVTSLSATLPNGYTNAVATAIDPVGRIVGYAMVNNQNHAILWQVGTAPAIYSNPLSATTVASAPFSFTFSVSGTPTPTVALTSGSLPSGLTLYSSGLLSGSPGQTGTFTGTVTASNGVSPVVTQNFSLVVLPAPVTSYATVGSFAYGYGYGAFGRVCQDTTGNLYDTSHNGGSTTNGTLIEMQTNGVETVAHNFGDGSVTNDGLLPSGIFPGPNGALYGTTTAGGSAGNGTFFTYSQGTVSILHNFSDGSVTNDGTSPIGPAILATDGNFYGAAQFGGYPVKNAGMIFKITPQGTETAFHVFGDGSVTNDGVTPMAGPIQGSDGNFYGTTYSGGSAANGGFGCVYQLTPAGSLTIIHAFSDGSVPSDGSYPSIGLAEGPDGAFYGITTYGGTANKGVIFKVTPSGQYSILHHIGDGSVINDISTPAGSMVLGPDGNLYGVSEYGGSANNGALYQLSSSGTMLILHSFNDGKMLNEGYDPYGGLYLSADGSYYGATGTGAASGFGGIFKFSIFSAPVFTNTSTTLIANSGQGYDFAFTANGSPAPAFTLTAGNLPSGLTLSPDGVLSGTPTKDGVYVFTITASNGQGSPASQSFSLTITDPATDTPVMPPYGLAMLAALLVAAAIFKPRPYIS